MRRADNLYHLHVPNALKSGSLNLLETSGPVQACNGIALPLPLCVVSRKVCIDYVPLVLIYNNCKNEFLGAFK